MIQGKTKTGFEFALDETVVDDMFFIETLAEADKGKYLAVASVLTMLLGEEQKKKLYEHVKDEKGHARVDDVFRETQEILTKIGEVTSKNSNTSQSA